MSSKVTDNAGKIIEVPDLNVPVAKIYNFVQINKADHFEDHSIEWALEEILTRGMAEITRQVKTARKVREDKAAGAVLKGFNLSPADAMKLLAELKAKQAKQNENAH